LQSEELLQMHFLTEVSQLGPAALPLQWPSPVHPHCWSPPKVTQAPPQAPEPLQSASAAQPQSPAVQRRPAGLAAQWASVVQSTQRPLPVSQRGVLPPQSPSCLQARQRRVAGSQRA
jgi:hypothetical protein